MVVLERKESGVFITTLVEEDVDLTGNNVSFIKQYNSGGEYIWMKKEYELLVGV